MPVVQRPAAAPRRVHRRPAAASELPQGVAAASYLAAQPPEGDAAESAIADEAWSEARDDGSRAQADDFGTGTGNFEGYRCVREKSPLDEFTADPLTPDHSMLSRGARLQTGRKHTRATLHERGTGGSKLCRAVKMSTGEGTFSVTRAGLSVSQGWE